MRLVVPSIACLAAISTPLVAAVKGEPSPGDARIVVASADQSDWGYLAFPALLDCGGEILASYKRARSHAQDAGAALELARLDPDTGAVRSRQMLARLDGQIMQMGEWVRFPHGDIANFIDVQVPGAPTTRTGVQVVRSSDGGRSFGPLQRLGAVDGVEYGYVFDSQVEGDTTWLLAMTFANLPGGRPAPGARKPAGSVDVLRSDDDGRSWRFVRNLSHEFGDVPINESAFLRVDEGFLVTTRGYDGRERLHLTDKDFHVIRQTDLTLLHSFITSFLGRPRLFARDGQPYLLGRNVGRMGTPMELALFRVDLAKLAVVSYVILDNAAHEKVTDGYYAMPWFRGAGAEARLHVLTYKGRDGRPPDIVVLSRRWSEIK